MCRDCNGLFASCLNNGGDLTIGDLALPKSSLLRTLYTQKSENLFS